MECSVGWTVEGAEGGHVERRDEGWGSLFWVGVEVLGYRTKMNSSEHMNRSHHGAHLCVEGDEGGLAGGDVVFGCDKVVCGVLLVDAHLPSLDRCVVARRRLLLTASTEYKGASHHTHFTWCQSMNITRCGGADVLSQRWCNRKTHMIETQPHVNTVISQMTDR